MENEEPKEWYDEFTDFVIKEWKKNGTVEDEQDTRDYLDAMMYLLGGYRLKCLIATLIDIDDLMEKFEEEHPECNMDEDKCNCENVKN